MEEDIRWEQRFVNYTRAHHKLTEAVDFIHDNTLKEKQLIINDANPVLDEIIKEGLIQRFENTHELAWNVMKDYAHYQGNASVGGSRDATREAFQLQLVSDGTVWTDMLGSRNKTSHTYDEETADEIYYKILHQYYSAFLEFKNNMESRRKGTQSEL